MNVRDGENATARIGVNLWGIARHVLCVDDLSPLTETVEIGPGEIAKIGRAAVRILQN